jgi:putative ABC transport system substrate-binding protein
MRRRELLLSLATGIMGTRPVRAQQKAMPVIGFLSSRWPAESAQGVSEFREGLRETGHVDGQNVSIEFRWAEGAYDRLPGLAADLVARNVDVIVASGAPTSALAARDATSTIPIVFATGDALAEGLVASLARPGGNLTGVSVLTIELMAKLFELLSEVVPRAKVIALLVNPNNPATEHMTREVDEAASTKGVQLAILRASTKSEIETAFTSLRDLHAGALVVSPDSVFIGRREQVVALASRFAVPAVYSFKDFAASGGLISYGPVQGFIFHQLGVYAGRIPQGREACRSACPATDQIRAGDQPQNRQGARPNCAANHARSRR